jgi:hypothetical protein
MDKVYNFVKSVPDDESEVDEENDFDDDGVLNEIVQLTKNHRKGSNAIADQHEDLKST